MVKNIAITVLGVIVLILGILGISKYKKNNSIDIGLGIGNIGIGSSKYKKPKRKYSLFDDGVLEIERGDFVKCIESEDTLVATEYFKFENNKLNKIMQFEIEGDVPLDYVKKHSKDELNTELLELICANDKDKPLCGNVKIKWDSNHVIMTFAVDLESYSNSNLKVGISKEEFINNSKSQNDLICNNISKSPIYAKNADPAGTYYNKVKNNYSGYKQEKLTVSDVKDAIKESRATAKEINKINQKDAEDSVSNISVKKADANKTTTGTVTKKCTKENLMIKAEPINVDSETSSIRVTVTNISKQTCKIDEISMTLKDKNGKFVMNLPVYVGETIKAGETRKTTSGTSADLFRVDSSKTIYTIK